MTPFLDAIRDAAGQYGPNACDLPHDVLGKLQALALIERHDWSDLCSTEAVERLRLEMLSRALELTGLARTLKNEDSWRAAEYIRAHIGEELWMAADDMTYSDVLFELEEAHNRLAEEQDEIAREDARVRARDLKASA